MAWEDILGGLAGGLSQGLGQVRQNVEARRRSGQVDKEMLLRALQEKRAAEEQERQALMAQFNAAEEGVEFDPSSPMVKVAGPAAFVKGPSGKGLMKKVSPNTQKAELELAEFNKDAPLRDANRADQMSQTQARTQLMTAYEQEMGPDWRRQLVGNEQVPLQKRQAAAMILYGKPDMFMSPNEKLKYSEQVGAAAVTAAGMSNYRDAQVQNMQSDNMAQMGQQFNTWLNTPAGKLASISHRNNPQALMQQWMQQRQAAGMAPTITSIQEIK